MIEIVAPGPLCTVQDGGRPGHAHLGVGRSGAVDRSAYRLANRLVGNPAGAAALEITFGGLIAVLHDACLLAVTGAPCATTVTKGGLPTHLDLGDQQPVAVAAGSMISFATPLAGVRTYLAVRGGLDTEVVLGSRSTNLLSGLGIDPLHAGDTLAVGPDPGTTVPTEPVPRFPVSDQPILIWPGPRRDWFESESIGRLITTAYVAQSTSNRIGVRLAGVPLVRSVIGELASEGLVEGAVQVPSDGQPLIFLADHPTTGGYPVIAVVDEVDIVRIAQARPGDPLWFRWAAKEVRGWTPPRATSS